ncbi:MAG: hypothetical protein ACRC3B_03750 [Bacteroidia bacterium]
MRWLPLLLLLILAGCRRDVSRSVTVNVKQATGGTASCIINYTANETGTEAVISSSAQNWSSPVRTAEPGEFMKVTVITTSPQYNYTVTVYVDGGIWKQSQLQNPQGSVTLSGDIPGI